LRCIAKADRLTKTPRMAAAEEARVAMPTWNEAAVAELIGQHRTGWGTLIVALHAILDAFGYVDRRAIPLLADAFNLSRAEVTGVVTFYRDFRATPPGRHVIKL
jgi:formate dehydrogenase subunit gamma